MENKKDYTSTVSMAKRLIEKFGVSMRFILPAAKRGAYNTATSSPVGIADIICDGFGVKLDFTEYEKKDSSIIEGDQKIIFFSEDDLKIGMEITIDGVVWEVVKPNPLKPADAKICYFAQVRS